MEKRNYIRVYNAEEKLFFKENDLNEHDKRCFINAGYKIDYFVGFIKRITYINSIKRLKELKG